VWVTAAIGLTCGAGMYLLAIISTALVLVGMEAFNYVLRLLNKDRNEV
jgi:putative Mg2+ transporter-C (MgtC) family protein